MISVDENALICDLAETYHIYDYRSLPVNLVATLSFGLRADSRIKMKLSDSKVSLNSSLIALLIDTVNYLRYELGGKKGSSKPQSVYWMLNNVKQENNYMKFKSGSDFEAYREALLRKKG